MMTQSNTKAPGTAFPGAFSMAFGELSEVSHVCRGLHVASPSQNMSDFPSLGEASPDTERVAHVATPTVSKKDWRTMVFKCKAIC